MLYVLGGVGGVSVEVLVELAGLWPKFMQGSLRKKKYYQMKIYSYAG